MNLNELKNYYCTILLDANENPNVFLSKKILRKELIEWSNLNTYDKGRYYLLNMTKLKSIASKNNLHFEKKFHRKELLQVLEDYSNEDCNNLNNNYLL